MPEDKDVKANEAEHINKSGEGEENGEETWQQLAGVDPKEFDTPEKLAKHYKEAQTNLSERDEKLKENEKALQGVLPVLNAVRNNPKIFKMVQSVLAGEEPELDTTDDKEDKSKDTKKPEPDTRVDELVEGKEAEVVKTFEEEFGISDMTEKDAEAARKEIGRRMRVMGFNDSHKPPLRDLNEIMSMAATHAGFQKKEKSSSVAGFGTPRAAVFTPESISADTLTPDEKKVAQKTGLSYEEYAKSKREIYS